MFQVTDDIRIDGLKPLIPPAILMEELPLSDEMTSTVADARKSVANCLNGEDDRIVVVAGPCSIHDKKAALEYGALLKKAIGVHVIGVYQFKLTRARNSIGLIGILTNSNEFHIAMIFFMMLSICNHINF